MHICLALIYLHERSIAHLDLKSANILIAQDGSMQLADVGQAFLVREGEAPRCQTGTYGWAAPEQLRRRPVSMKSDIFSLGVIIYEVIPFVDISHRPGLSMPAFSRALVLHTTKCRCVGGCLEIWIVGSY